MLRFKNDDGTNFPDWEEKSVGDITIELKEYEQLNSGYPLMTSSRIGLMMQEDFRTKSSTEDDTAIFSVVPRGVATYRHMSDDNIFHFNINNLVDKGLVSKEYPVFNTVNGNSLYLLVEYLNSSKKFLNFCKAQKKGGTRTRLYFKVLKEFKFNVPSLPEQQKIAEFLSTIDTVIEKQKETVSAWEERKKGMMQKLFSQEVRFKADDGSNFPDWEEKSFLDVFENLNNSTFSRDCLNYEAGNVKYIHYGDILTKFGFAIDVQSSNVPYVNEDLDCEKYASLSDGDIVIADTAEDDTVGRAVEIMNAHCGKTISGLHTIACHPREKFASKYLGYFMNADIYHNQLRPYMQGIKVTSVSKTNIVLTKILVPCLAEQQKIADCLSSLDEVIEKQKATLAAWEELKKGLLQQMFV